MKTLIKLFLIFLFPVKIFSQDIAGVWKGTIYNDTTQKYIPYQIAISENKGKLSGYSHTVFTTGDKRETGIKIIKINKKNGQIFIEDDKLIFNNYGAPPPKGVRQFSALVFSEKDSVFILSGSFTTNRTREYVPLTGTIYLTKQKDFSKTEIAQKLTELDLWSALSFNRQQVKKDIAVVDIKKIKEEKTKTEAMGIKEKIKPDTILVKSVLPLASVNLKERKIETIKTVFIKTDSIKITLYDNGEIDGDVVSVIMNGQIIIANLLLSAKPVTKTIYFKPGENESIQLIMYAENLGSIPPNTGLLIIEDGSERYEIRFAGDLQKNSAIILRRKSH